MKYILRGNSSIHIIGTVNQEDKYIMETLNTLNFISKAKRIEVHPKMNFQTKNQTANENHISQLLEQIQFLENEKKALRIENETLQVELDIEKEKEPNKILEQESIIKDLKEKISIFKKNKEDLDKTIILKNKRYLERKRTKNNGNYKIFTSINYLRPKLKKKRKRSIDLKSLVYNSQEKDKLKFLTSKQKSIDFGKIIIKILIKRKQIHKNNEFQTKF